MRLSITYLDNYLTQLIAYLRPFILIDVADYVIDSSDRSDVADNSEDVGKSDYSDIIDDGNDIIDTDSDSIKKNNEISYLDIIDRDEIGDIIDSTYRNVNTTKSYYKNYHPFRYVHPTMTTD
ncbi:MAG: hypothetical protein O4861_09435 [Trichodesmium sp. St16_bin4-tuft]|nr:hypothetical protein [Trichodesmium sp. St4_bin8_1]MDE5071160.1 hypothetical protein [Trichodesmium sp. St5_bin8]MDE5090661.1 hypothetical protein [Trichodesmium sp. St18_bin3_1_1]MDE5098542.1 hypothetical protein [Trichodesmium sp. St16_bin4-tuft]MDE5103124.1 hypothetical protein [Trichodesmium sp. St19_bin2]